MMDAALAVVGWLDLGASVVLAGGLVFGALVGKSDARIGRAAVGALVLALGLEFVFTAVRMKDVSGISGARLVIELLGTRWGWLWSLRLAVLPLLASRSRVGVLVTAPWLLLRSLQGHAGAHGTIPALVDCVHLVAAAVWIGGLLELARLPGSVPAAVARRFRVLATTSLALLVPAGIYGAVLHVQRWSMLLGSPYGRVLVVKLGLAAVLIALGALNHFRYVPAVVSRDVGASGRFARTVRLEVLLAAAVLLCSATLGVLAMPHVHVHAGLSLR